MPRVTRLLLLFVLVGVAVMSSITRSPSARAGPVRVLGADVAKMSSYSAASQYLSPSSGRPSSQLQNTKRFFPSRQRGRDYEAILPERKGPANGLLARQGEDLDRYRVVVLKSAPGHPLHQSAGHPEKEEEEEEAAAALRFAGMPSGDAPQRLARRRDHAGGQSAWKTPSVVWSQAGRYVSRKDADEPTEAFVPRRANVIQPGGFPPWGVTASAEENLDASLFQHGPQPEKPTSSLADDGRRAAKSFLVKSSFLRREDLGKPWHSPSVSAIEKLERIPKYSRNRPAAVHLPPNAGRYPATLRERFPPHLAAQSSREKLWLDAAAPPAPATDTVGATTSRRPVRPTPSQRAGGLLASKRSEWPASKAFARVSPTGRGKSYGLKMANVYPSLSSKYSFGQRKVEPRATAAPSAIGFPRPQNLERRPLKRPSHRLEAADTAARPSNGSAALQVFRALDRTALRFASTSPSPERAGPRRDEVPAFATERNERRSERLFGTSGSSTVRGRRVYAAPRGGPETVAGNSPIVRRPQGELAANATAPPTAAALPNLTKSGVGFSGSGVPSPTSPKTTLQSQKNTQRHEESSASEVFDDGTDETLQEDLLQLNYLRISTGNVSFKSI